MTAVEATGVDAGLAWVAVCDVARVRPDRGVAVFVGGQSIAVFRLSALDDRGEEWCAVSHIDPTTGAPVMARGLVGSVGVPPLVIPTLASPLHKERYNLRTGHGLDHAGPPLATYPVRAHNGNVEIGKPVTAT